MCDRSSPAEHEYVRIIHLAQQGKYLLTKWYFSLSKPKVLRAFLPKPISAELRFYAYRMYLDA